MIKFLQSIGTNKTLSAIVAKNIQGFAASVSEVTDTISLNNAAAEMFGFRNNMKLLCFDETTSSSREDMYKMGIIDFGIYNSDGLTKFNQITTTRDGKPPTALSYAGGNDANKLAYLGDILGGRNSNYEIFPDSTEYTNLTDVQLISRPSTMRFNYYSEMFSRPNFIAGTNQEGINKVNQYISNIISVNGWYNDFMHWHWWAKDFSKDYFNLIGQLVSDNDIYSGSYSDIVEYYFVKNSINNVTYSSGSLRINYTKKFNNSNPYNNIATPAWIIIESDVDIECSNNQKIRKINANTYAVPVFLDFTTTQVTVNITTTQSPNYLNLTKPIVTRNGNNISSDQPIKYTLFSNLKSNTYELSTIREERNFNYLDSHILQATLDMVNKDYFLGFINEDGASGTLEF